MSKQSVAIGRSDVVPKLHYQNEENWTSWVNMLT